MNLRDSLEGLGAFWKEFSKNKTGLVGLGLLAVFVLLGLFGTLVVPFPGAIDHWRDIGFWQDNPQAAPPVWTNWFAKRKGVVSSVLDRARAEESTLDSGARVSSLTFDYDFGYDLPPRDVVVRFEGSGLVPVTITLERPDGLVAELYRAQLELSEGDVQRVSLARNCSQEVIEFLRASDEALAASLDADLVKPVSLLFSRLSPGMAESPEALKGAYRLKVNAFLFSEDARLAKASAVVSGHVSGIFGTDMAKRDVFTGLVIGIRWALVIGLLTSIVTVMAGVLLGVTAAYMGGATDWLLSRLYELIFLMPVLPFLIVVSAIFKPTIWTLILIICLFFWAGPFKPVYSMALQIKEETFVEASRALGSRSWRIILRHIIPILLPYSFASMALAIPSVIVYEASVSLLGLGDSSIVTWGQLLNDALGQGAVINQLWWWVVPPGLMIALMGMSFAFLGTALDKILHPKLKTR